MCVPWFCLRVSSSKNSLMHIEIIAYFHRHFKFWRLANDFNDIFLFKDKIYQAWPFKEISQQCSMDNVIDFFHYNKSALGCLLWFKIFFIKTEIYDFEILQYQLHNGQFIYLITIKLDQIVIHSTCFTNKHGHWCLILKCILLSYIQNMCMCSNASNRAICYIGEILTMQYNYKSKL